MLARAGSIEGYQEGIMVSTVDVRFSRNIWENRVMIALYGGIGALASLVRCM